MSHFLLVHTNNYSSPAAGDGYKVIVTGPGQLYGFSAINQESTTRFVQIFDGYVQPLMPLITAGKQHDKLPVVPGTRTSVKNARIDMVYEDRAFLIEGRARNHGLVPEMVGNNHVVCEGRRHLLDPLQEPEEPVLFSRCEFARE